MQDICEHHRTVPDKGWIRHDEKFLYHDGGQTGIGFLELDGVSVREHLDSVLNNVC